MAYIDPKLERALEEVDRLKLQVSSHQASLSQLKFNATTGRSAQAWNEYNEAKLHQSKLLRQLQVAKQTLRKLSGNGIVQPKLETVAEAWAVLTNLLESGIDIGARGRKTVESIEFMLSNDLLDKAMQKEEPNEQG